MSTCRKLVNDARLLEGTDPAQACQLLVTARQLLAQVGSAHAEMQAPLASKFRAADEPPAA